MQDSGSTDAADAPQPREAERLDELRRAVRRGDVAGARAVLTAAPGLAAAQSRGGGSLALEAYERDEPDLAAMILEARDGGAMVGLDVHEAAAMGRPAALKHALTEDMLGFEEVGPAGFLPLHRAAFGGHVDVTTLLIEFGADPTTPADNAARPTPLHSAVAGAVRARRAGGAERHARAVELLVRAGADPDAEMEGGWTPRTAAERDGLRDALPALFAPDSGSDADAGAHSGADSKASDPAADPTEPPPA